MRLLCLISLMLALTMTAGHAGSEHLVKQRAKDLRDQNNERQGVAPNSRATPSPSQPVAPAQPTPTPYAAAPAAPQLSPQAARIVKSLETVSKSKNPSDEAKQQLTDDIAAAVRGAAKPSPSKIEKLGRDFAKAVAGTELSATQSSKLAGQIERALNESLSAKDMEALAAEMTETLKAAGAGKIDAAVVSNDIKSVIAEVQRNSRN